MNSFFGDLLIGILEILKIHKLYMIMDYCFFFYFLIIFFNFNASVQVLVSVIIMFYVCIDLY